MVKKIPKTGLFVLVCLLPTIIFGFFSSPIIQPKNRFWHATTAAQNQMMYMVNDMLPSSNKTADQITPQELKNVLSKPSNVEDFTVVILPVSSKNQVLGYLNFLILETSKLNGNYQTKFADAKSYQSDDDISELNTYGFNSLTPKKTNVFATAKFNNLSNWIKALKYQIQWKKDEQIKEYIQNTNAPLTSQAVWLNLIENNSLPPLNGEANKPKTIINVEKVANLNGTMVNGLYKITLNFQNTDAKMWADNQVPSNVIRFFGGFEQTKLEVLGGDLKNQSVSKENVFRFVSGAKVNDSTQAKTTNNIGVAASGSLMLKQISPSEFIAPFSNNNNDVVNVFANNMWLTNQSDKLLNLIYGNLKFAFVSTSASEYQEPNMQPQVSNETDFYNKIVTQNKIYNIDFTPNDQDGSLRLVIYYVGWDVYTGKLAPLQAVYLFPADSFLRDQTGNLNFFISWKKDSELVNLNYSFEVINEYYRNRMNAEYVRLFTNRFLNASPDVLALQREVVINYADNNGRENDITHDWESIVRSDSLKITLTFKNFHNKSDFRIENVFKFQGYQYEQNNSLKIDWKSNAEYFANNPSFKDMIATDVVKTLLPISNPTANEAQKNTLPFNVLQNNYEVTYLPDNAQGTIMVYIRAKTGDNKEVNNFLYQQMYIGFKKDEAVGNRLFTFTFLPQIDVDPNLLKIPLSQVTSKDVFDYYLNKIDLFKNQVITSDKVKIITHDTLDDPYISVEVVIDNFNQSVVGITPSQQTFFTKIRGFSHSNTKDQNQINPQENLTAVLSITLTTFFSLFFGIFLFSLVIIRSSIRKFKLFNKKKYDKKEK